MSMLCAEFNYYHLFIGIQARAQGEYTERNKDV
ncbi:hypothetical protein YPC_3212 [Yersinia pestis biovar Medievalis str. Harbin 35]|nr:hypothetical protein YPC_3212 [Yersinia pestis biovar Medievalis str. Harbin 35]EEO77565.1 hypothetical protein YP516_1242 [Yersinia pestis Nepal516]EEO80306.1 hypothetical protein YPF_3122 [Yersinia pestis biovar Orientalis str. India 195]EEO84614.1 hypothetical protein YPH_0433 [Yersinia pestis biovar Orientalis str. PEXU2]EEO89635.1 hypothetical protein YPS_3239 [Yersinia pestis Pestoides A]